jgi:6-phosphogluconolactonase
MAQGAGPRHLAFHPNGKLAYALNEWNSTLSVLGYDSRRGTLRPVQSLSTLPANFVGYTDSPAEIAVHPAGRFVYASNRGHDSIAVFAVDDQKGTLTPVEDVPTGGKTPRSFVLDPTGTRLFVANQDSGNIVVFRIDSATGHLTRTGQTLPVPSPVSIEFVTAALP